MKKNNSKLSMWFGDIRCVELISTDNKHLHLVIHEKIDDEMNSSIIDCSNINHIQLFDVKIEDDEYERIKF